MKTANLTFLILFCAACGAGERIPPAEDERGLPQAESEAMKAKLSLYLDLTHEVRNEWGFVPKCDSLLFTSLSYVAGYPADIEAAEDDGRWYRRPEKECYENGKDPDAEPGSHSDISKDMILGMLWSTWYMKDKKKALSRLQRLIDYSKGENWKVGRGPAGSTFITPPLRNTIAQMVFELGGKDHKVMRAYPMVWAKGLEGYQAHIQVLHILLRKKVMGDVSSKAHSRIIEHHRRNPKNAFFSYAYYCFHNGDYRKAADILLNEDYFPDRLPESRDRCTEYLWQREKSVKDWGACPKEKLIHDGVDYMFVAKLILEEVD